MECSQLYIPTSQAEGEEIKNSFNVQKEEETLIGMGLE